MDAPAVFRFVHIVAGVIALISFPVPLVVAKGNRTHRLAGRVYAVSMAVVVVCAFIVCGIRLADDNADNDATAVFLAFVGLLSGINVVLGLRALTDANKQRRGRSTDVIALGAVAVLVVVSGVLVGVGAAHHNVLQTVFGGLGIFLGVSNARTLLRAPVVGGWLVQHLNNMLAACIGTVTAVVVVNAKAFGVPSDWMAVVWVAPGVIGGVLIARFSARYKKT